MKNKGEKEGTHLEKKAAFGKDQRWEGNSMSLAQEGEGGGSLGKICNRNGRLAARVKGFSLKTRTVIRKRCNHSIRGKGGARVVARKGLC